MTRKERAPQSSTMQERRILSFKVIILFFFCLCGTVYNRAILSMAASCLKPVDLKFKTLGLSSGTGLSTKSPYLISTYLPSYDRAMNRKKI